MSSLVPIDSRAPGATELAPPAQAAFVPCSDCKQPIRTYYYALNGDRPVCARCKPEYAARIERGAGRGALPRVLLYGGATAAGLAVVLGGLIVVMGALRLVAAVGVGYAIGRAINAATGHFYDRRYQVIAAVLTYLTLGVASLLPVLVEAARHEPPPVAVAPAPAPSAAAAPAAGEENPWASVDSLVDVVDANDGRLPVEREPTAGERLAQGNAVSRVANSLLMILFLPIVGLFGYGLYAAGLGVFALGFGIHKAWEITGQGVAYELGGPHRVGTGPIDRTF